MLFAIFLGKAAVQEDDSGQSQDGRVYVLTNQAPVNTVAVLRRAADGTLTRLQEVLTGGSGSGPGPRPPQFPPGPGPDPLNSADAITLTEDGRFLLAVNPRSNDLSVLAVTQEGLQLVDKASTQGIFPVSVATKTWLGLRGQPGTKPYQFRSWARPALRVSFCPIMS